MPRGSRGRSPSPSRAKPMGRAPDITFQKARANPSYQKQAAPSVPMRAAQPATPAVAAAAPQGPGLMGQMAATAGGVAIGSAIGHTVGHAMTGMFSGGSDNAAAVPAQAPAVAYQQEEQTGGGGACAWEMKQFLQCAQQQDDLSLCAGFNEALRQCKQSQGLGM